MTKQAWVKIEYETWGKDECGSRCEHLMIEECNYFDACLETRGACQDVMRCDDCLSLDESQATLFAAAPDLLKELIAAKELIKFYHGDPGWDIYDKHSPEMKAINAAIAKTKGETK